MCSEEMNKVFPFFFLILSQCGLLAKEGMANVLGKHPLHTNDNEGRKNAENFSTKALAIKVVLVAN